MRSAKGTSFKKKALAATLAVGMVFGMLGLENLSQLVQAAWFGSENVTYTDGATTRVRRVLGDLPSDWSTLKANWNSMEKGSPERPFTILEIVPYEEFAEIGYMIEGCEPVPMEKFTGNSGVMTSLMYTPMYSDMFKISIPVDSEGNQEDIFFFEDEPEGKNQYYLNSELANSKTTLRISGADWAGLKQTASKQIRGYYEVVEDGKGTFNLITDEDGKRSFKPVNIGASETGNIIWHTVNQFEEEKIAAEGGHITYYERVENMNVAAAAAVDMSSIGKRFYTYRNGGEDEPYVNVKGYYYDYVNYDVFSSRVLGLTKEQAKNYSIQVKTITTAELNANMDWLDMADLIYIDGQSKVADFRNLWICKDNAGNGMNRLKKQSGFYNPTGAPTVPDDGFKGTYGSEYSSHQNEKKDISWPVAKRIIERISSARNYAALIFNANGLNGNNLTKKSVTYKHYDVNNRLFSPADSFGMAGYLENIGKLWVMSTSLNPNMVNQIFIKTNRIKVNSEGYAYIDGRSGDEGLYWSGASFYIGTAKINDANGSSDVNGDYWDSYSGNIDINNIGGSNVYVQGHVYYYNGDMSLATGLMSDRTSAADMRFNDFGKYIETNAKTKEIWIDANLKKTIDGEYLGTRSEAAEFYEDNMNPNSIAPFAALRYILDMDSDTDTYYGDVKILEIEPSVELDTANNYNTKWKLTKEEVLLMLPNCSGNITIESMVSTSFNGRIEDLNNEYDLIYLGDQDDGFYKDDNRRPGRTNFNDNNMDGLIYFNQGDVITVDGSHNGNVNFVHGFNTGTNVRLPGNDFTNVKVNDLIKYMQSGKPVVAADNLYKEGYVDSNPVCEIYNFLNGNRATVDENGEYSFGILGMSDVAEIDSRVKYGKSIKMDIYDIPVKYNPDGSGTHAYLPTMGNRGYLKFKVKVPETGVYGYKIYVDKNRNSKFEELSDVLKNEVMKTGVIDELDTTIIVQMSENWVGCLQWRIEVYLLSNTQFRVSKEGTSAIAAAPGIPKNRITALQICPDGWGNTDLTSSAWTSLYNQVTDFDITVKRVQFKDFNKIFKDNYDALHQKFVFNMGRPVDLASETNTNPDKHITEELEKRHIGGMEGGRNLQLKDYNMLIFGFADMYGGCNLSNEFGAVEYLYYFTQKGCSILFCHDLTCYYNKTSEKKYGYTTNSMMREYMGMNRFGALSDRLYTDRASFREGLVDGITGYKTLSGAKYDKPSTNDLQGFTTWCAYKKIKNGGGKAQYRYLDTPGGNCETDRARVLNEGQITQYPFLIPEVLPVASTHAQYYELNLEDPEVTVWYTVENSKVNGGNKSASVTSIYQVMPQDAADHYYIYSKGNIFYTGVGHSGISSGADGLYERQLFVNTLIAAYRPQFEAPEVFITNEGVAPGTESRSYTLAIEQDFDNAGASGTYPVTFVAKDYSGCPQVNCYVHYKDHTTPLRVYKVVDDGHGNKIRGAEADNTGGVYVLNVDEEYMIEYPKANLRTTPPLKDIVFETTNAVAPDKTGVTNLEMLPQMLFRLD